MNKHELSEDDTIFQNNMMSSFIQIAALVILVGYCLMVVGPFIGTIVWGIILAVAVYPLHAKLTAVLGGKEKVSATIIVIVGLVILLVPGWQVTASSVGTAKSVATEIKDGTFAIPPPDASVADWPVIGNKVYTAWSAGAQNIGEFLTQYQPQLKEAGEWLVHAAGAMIVAILYFTASIIIAGVCLMYANSGYELARAIGNRVTPTRGGHLADLSIATVRSVTNGVLGVATIQAVLAGIGFAVMGVPAAGALTIAILVTAIIQIPAILIMAPLIVWVYSFADPIPATIFAIYSVLVALSDNVLKPLLLGRGVDLPVLVVLLGAIGGMVRFGVIGLFIGAVLLGLGYRIFCDWIWPDDSAEDAA